MTARTALLVALALVPACKKEGAPSAAPETGRAGSAGPALEPGVKPQPSEAAPEGTKPEAKPVEAAPAAQVWDKFTSKDGGFTIELPGKAEERDQNGVKMVGAEFGATASDPRTSMCGAAYVTLPAVEDAKTTLEGAVAKHKENATVVEDKEIMLGKVPGRSLIVENTSHRKWMRVYLDGKKLFIINCGGPFDRAATDGPLALKAVASFALTK